MQTILTFLKGKKTYLGLIAAGILGLSWSYGLVDEKVAETIAIFIATWTGISLRSAMSKS